MKIQDSLDMGQVWDEDSQTYHDTEDQPLLGVPPSVKPDNIDGLARVELEEMFPGC